MASFELYRRDITGRAQSFEFEQPGDPVLAAGLAQIAHVQGELAVAAL